MYNINMPNFKKNTLLVLIEIFIENWYTYLNSVKGLKKHLLWELQYADPKMAGLIKEGPAIFGSAYCTLLRNRIVYEAKSDLSNPYL